MHDDEGWRDTVGPTTNHTTTNSRKFSSPFNQLYIAKSREQDYCGGEYATDPTNLDWHRNRLTFPGEYLGRNTLNQKSAQLVLVFLFFSRTGIEWTGWNEKWHQGGSIEWTGWNEKRRTPHARRTSTERQRAKSTERKKNGRIERLMTHRQTARLDLLDRNPSSLKFTMDTRIIIRHPRHAITQPDENF